MEESEASILLLLLSEIAAMYFGSGEIGNENSSML
jgi:hypothetical protein